MPKLHRAVIIDNVCGLTLQRNAALLVHVKDCLQALHYSIRIRIMCTSQSAVLQSHGLCYVVGIRGPKVGLKWPNASTTVGLQHFVDRHIIKNNYEMNARQTKPLGKLAEKRKGRWASIVSMLALP